MFETIAAVAGPILGAAMQADAAGDAANIQAGATREGIGEQRREFDLTRADTAPYRDAGASALGKLRGWLGLGAPAAASASPARSWQSYYDDALGRAPMVGGSGVQTDNPIANLFFNMGNTGPAPSRDTGWARTEADRLYGEQQQSAEQVPSTPSTADASNPYGTEPLNRRFSINDFWQDPVVQLGYQSGLDLGTKALRNAAPLTTGLDSGAALKELTKFGTDYTGMKAGESQGRFETEKGNVFNRLMALIGGGQQAVNTATAAGTSTAGNVTNLIGAQGNAGGAARIAGANAWGGALNNLSNWWNQSSMLDKVLNRGGVSGMTPTSNFAFTGMGAGGYQYG